MNWSFFSLSFIDKRARKQAFLIESHKNILGRKTNRHLPEQFEKHELTRPMSRSPKENNKIAKSGYCVTKKSKIQKTLRKCMRQSQTRLTVARSSL